ncbi:copper/zinc binding superoxide dismutase [Guyanagaster necrorhizus]|uniref:Superoxide dismutase [Cu-Zn] n=1 Tax=Guyanagaster necrorhizus TaxID=856835 RepID=A0A9P8ARD0_9AGAR|nr:copper/zinc binding superoxide dismutase [Guyanagaster necrorhizus MCA 3950]KAG7443737.1 copper/zinc binding superoxide dismutase [Guyanagaster necrorhizus MCA 3950]
MFKYLLLALAISLPVFSKALDDSCPCALARAVAVLKGPSIVTGTVIFTQCACDKDGSEPVHVEGRIQGLTPNALRGFHVHQYGNLTDGCTSAGEHWNPFNATHGGLKAPINKRHAGDLGNIESNGNGVAVFDIANDLMTLKGPLSIVGRTIVVHAGTDDLGKGNATSLINGNSGARSACGVIAIGTKD